MRESADNGMLFADKKTYDLQKSFTRIIVPSYYIQEENYDDTDSNNDNFFVV